VGTVASGWIADYFRVARGATGALRIIGVTSLASLPFLLAAILAPGAVVSIGCLGIALTLSNFMSTLMPLALQAHADENLRAQTAALFLLLANIVGYGLGPSLPALVSDYVFHDPESVGWAVVAVASIGTLLSVVAIWWPNGHHEPPTERSGVGI